MNYRVLHRTTYDYAEPVTVSHHVARVEPRVLPFQHRQSFQLSITPRPVLRKNRADYFGNRVCSFSIQQIHRRLEINAESLVTVTRRVPTELSKSPPWEQMVALFRDPVSPRLVEPYQFCFDSPLLSNSPVLAEYSRESFLAGTPLLAGTLDLTHRIFHDFKYDPVATTVATPIEEVLAKRRGVCQDFAHLGVASLRSLGLAARYVSGYIRTHPTPGKERFVGADASHAWFAVYGGHLGWVDFDPTNNLMPSDEHITLAYGRDFSDVSPLNGIITGGGKHEVKVAVAVDPLNSTENAPAGQ